MKDLKHFNLFISLMMCAIGVHAEPLSQAKALRAQVRAESSPAKGIAYVNADNKAQVFMAKLEKGQFHILQGGKWTQPPEYKLVSYQSIEKQGVSK